MHNSISLRLIMRLALITMVFLSVGLADTQGQDLQRGFKNYQAIASGEKKFDQLSAEEQTEVLIIYRMLSAPSGPSNNSYECRDAWDQAESAADDLASYAKRLKNCAEGRDFDDDCYSEFRRTKSAYDDYESAVSDVQSYCN